MSTHSYPCEFSDRGVGGGWGKDGDLDNVVVPS